MPTTVEHPATHRRSQREETSCSSPRLDGTGGLVNQVTLTEHLLYEVHDPGNYLMPEGGHRLHQRADGAGGADSVKVWGARGKPAPATLKAVHAHTDGYIGEVESSVTWPGRGNTRRAACSRSSRSASRW